MFLFHTLSPAAPSLALFLSPSPSTSPSLSTLQPPPHLSSFPLRRQEAILRPGTNPNLSHREIPHPREGKRSKLCCIKSLHCSGIYSFGGRARLQPSAIGGGGSEGMAASEKLPEGYRANVGVCLVNREGNFFAASRLDMPGAWQMPQGGIDEGEEPREAAVRELREETGVTSAEIMGESPGWLAYDFPPAVRERIAQHWGKAWKGQAQKWFLFRFLGDDSEISLMGDGSEKPEFGDWKWSPAEEVISEAVDFKRPVYEKVFEAFRPLLLP